MATSRRCCRSTPACIRSTTRSPSDGIRPGRTTSSATRCSATFCPHRASQNRCTSFITSVSCRRQTIIPQIRAASRSTTSSPSAHRTCLTTPHRISGSTLAGGRTPFLPALDAQYVPARPHRLDVPDVARLADQRPEPPQPRRRIRLGVGSRTRHYAGHRLRHQHVRRRGYASRRPCNSSPPMWAFPSIWMSGRATSTFCRWCALLAIRT